MCVRIYVFLENQIAQSKVNVSALIASWIHIPLVVYE